MDPTSANRLHVLQRFAQALRFAASLAMYWMSSLVRGKAREGFIQEQNLFIIGRGGNFGVELVRTPPAAAVPDSPFAAGPLHQDAAHRFGRSRKKCRRLFHCCDFPTSTDRIGPYHGKHS